MPSAISVGFYVGDNTNIGGREEFLLGFEKAFWTRQSF